MSDQALGATLGARRTRIKMCGLTRAADVEAAVAAGADALGFVFYPPSPRFVAPELAATLVRRVPAFVSTVALFVNADDAAFDAVIDAVAPALLQFHGDETPERCETLSRRAGRPYMRAARVRPGLDLLEFSAQYQSACALLLDAFVDGYGGGGHVFDWTLIPERWREAWRNGISSGGEPPVVLSGGLNAHNVGDALARVRPFAVDVSSGIEARKGVKDTTRMNAFVAAVRAADAAA